MKLEIISTMLLGIALGFLASCNQLEPVALEYKEDPRYSAPEIDASWGLELLPIQVNERVYGYKDKKYDGFFTRTLGWNGGDGVLSVKLPDGNIFWTFNDSFYGVVENETRNRKSCNFPRNTIMVQVPGETNDSFKWLVDYVQTDNPNGERYYQARTHLRHPSAKKSAQEIAAGDIDQDYLYWSGDGTIVGDKLQFLWNGVDTTDPENSMRPMGTCLVTYSLKGTPGDGEYLKIISADHTYLMNNPYGYGSTLYEDEDGHTYLYGANGYDILVARTETHDLTSKIQYYVCNEVGEYSWQDNYPTEEEAKRSAIQDDGISMPWVIKKGDYYYLTGQAIFFGREAHIFIGKTPYGPFTDHQTLFKVPDELDKLGVKTYRFAYMFNQHPHLSRDGELVFSINCDTESFWDNFNAEGSADFYRPYFFRVFKWERLFEDYIKNDQKK